MYKRNISLIRVFFHARILIRDPRKRDAFAFSLSLYDLLLSFFVSIFVPAILYVFLVDIGIVGFWLKPCAIIGGSLILLLALLAFDFSYFFWSQNMGINHLLKVSWSVILLVKLAPI